MKYFFYFAAVIVAVFIAPGISENVEKTTDVIGNQSALEERALPTPKVIMRKIEELRQQLIFDGYNNIEFHDFELPLDLPALGISGAVKATGLVRGLLDFDLTLKVISLLPPTYRYGITWSEIDIRIEPYDLRAAVHLIQLYGKGGLHVNIKNLDINGKFSVKLLGGPSIRSFEINVNLDEPQNDEWFKLTGWLGDDVRSQIVSELVTDNAQDLLKEYQAEIKKFLSAAIFDLIKDIKIPFLM